jgi:hypothetical protein
MFLKLTKLAKLTLRSKFFPPVRRRRKTTIDMYAEEEEKTTARTIVDNSVNFDNFERSVNSRKLN